MPTNKKEGILFTSLMCFLMVLGMSLYNLFLHDDLSVGALLQGLVPGFVVAFILDTFVVGVIAKKIAFKLPINKEKRYQVILSISFFMVLGMVSLMSLFGIIIEGGIPGDLGSAYLQAWKMNFIVALPFQLLIVGPISRTVLGYIQKAAAVAS
jgi:biotin transporter BioY